MKEHFSEDEGPCSVSYTNLQVCGSCWSYGCTINEHNTATLCKDDTREKTEGHLKPVLETALKFQHHAQIGLSGPAAETSCTDRHRQMNEATQRLPQTPNKLEH